MSGEVCVLNHLQWNSGGDADIYATRSSNAAQEICVTRPSSYQGFSNGNANGNYDGVRCDCVASGYATYDQIRIKVNNKEYSDLWA